jgi:hypothetical protein
LTASKGIAGAEVRIAERSFADRARGLRIVSALPGATARRDPTSNEAGGPFDPDGGKCLD